MDVKFIRIDPALDDALAQSPDTCHQHDVAKATFGVERERHAAGRQVGPHHLHDAHGKTDLEVIEAICVAIDDRPIGEGRRKALSARLFELGDALDVEEAVMLPGKARRRQIFGGGGTANSDRDPRPVHRFEFSIALHEHRSDPVRTRCGVDEGPSFGSRSGQAVDVIRADPVEQGRQLRPGAARSKRLAVHFRRQGEAVRHLHTLPGQRRDHLAQRRILPADRCQISGANVPEPADMGG